MDDLAGRQDIAALEANVLRARLRLNKLHKPRCGHAVSGMACGCGVDEVRDVIRAQRATIAERDKGLTVLRKEFVCSDCGEAGEDVQWCNPESSYALGHHNTVDVCGPMVPKQVTSLQEQVEGYQSKALVIMEEVKAGDSVAPLWEFVDSVATDAHREELAALGEGE